MGVPPVERPQQVLAEEPLTLVKPKPVLVTPTPAKLEPTLAAPHSALTPIKIGDTYLLSTTGSTYDKFIWKVIPEEASVEPYFFDLTTRDGRPLGLCTYPKNCTVIFATATNDPSFELDVALVNIEHNLKPDPDPDPDPDQKYQIGFFFESKNKTKLSSDQKTILNSLLIRQELTKRGHSILGFFDKDIRSPGGIPPKLEPWWEAIKGDPLPRIAIAPVDGGEIDDFPLPANPPALWEMLGGEK
jgi:hypothetical protein